MNILCKGGKTYLYLNGLIVSKPLRISPSIELLPAKCTANPKIYFDIAKNDIDFGIMIIFLRQIGSQFLVIEDDPKKQVFLAVSSLWHAILLSAIFDCEIECNFQSDVPAEVFNEKSNLRVVSYLFRGLTSKPYVLSNKESEWLENNFEKARVLMERSHFENAVWCMANYRWHPASSIRLAVIWAGIEGLFKIDSEIVFKLSLCIARFLEPNNEINRKELFKDVKELYKSRSKAVHGSELKDKDHSTAEKSAKLLQRLILTCIERNCIPCIDDLVP